MLEHVPWFSIFTDCDGERLRWLSVSRIFHSRIPKLMSEHHLQNETTSRISSNRRQLSMMSNRSCTRSHVRNALREAICMPMQDNYCVQTKRCMQKKLAKEPCLDFYPYRAWWCAFCTLPSPDPSVASGDRQHSIPFLSHLAVTIQMSRETVEHDHAFTAGKNPLTETILHIQRLAQLRSFKRTA